MVDEKWLQKTIIPMAVNSHVGKVTDRSKSLDRWERNTLELYANRPSFINKISTDPSYLSDINKLNNEIPMDKVYIFNDQNVVEYSLESFENSALIKLPMEDGSRGFVDVHAGILHPFDDFSYSRKDLGFSLSSQTIGDVYDLSFEYPDDFPAYRLKLIASDILSNLNYHKAPDDILSKVRLTFNNHSFEVGALGSTSSASKHESTKIFFEEVMDSFTKAISKRKIYDESYTSSIKRISEKVRDRSVSIVAIDKSIGKARSNMNIVFSDSPDDLLLYEEYFIDLMNIEKKSLSKSEKKKLLENVQYYREEGVSYLELGRFGVSKENRIDTPMLLQFSLATSFGQKVDKVVAVGDATHFRLFEPFGFEKKASYIDPNGIEYFVLEASPETLLSKTMNMQLKDKDIPVDVEKSWREFLGKPFIK